MAITKLDVAEREIVAATRLLFDGGDSVAVYVLAAAAREITTTLCGKRGISGFLDDAAESHPHLSKKEMYRVVSRHARFFKHADLDPEAVLEDFAETEPESVLYIAAHDFGRICGWMPVEAQVLELWFLALHAPTALPSVALMYLLPDLSRKSRPEQLVAGKQLLEWAQSQPQFREAARSARLD